MPILGLLVVRGHAGDRVIVVLHRLGLAQTSGTHGLLMSRKIATWQCLRELRKGWSSSELGPAPRMSCKPRGVGGDTFE